MAKKSMRGTSGKRSPSSEKPPESAGSGGRIKEPEKERIRAGLLSLRQSLTGQVSALTSDALAAHDAINPEEDGTEEFDRDFALQLATSSRKAVLDIDEALHRLDEGTYGTCEECNKTIAKPRLQALPFVKTCIECQAEFERRNGRSTGRRV